MPEIEFWFEFGSVYSYLSVMRIENEAKKQRRKHRLEAILVGGRISVFGFRRQSPVAQKEKRAYVLKDVPRLCRKYGLRWVEPSTFPRSGVLPLRIALLGIDKPWIGDYCRRVMELNYVLDGDINQPDRLAPILTELGLVASDILDQAKSESTKAFLREQTETATRKGVFGAPTFFVGTEMFWGNDRLDDALQFASEQRK